MIKGTDDKSRNPDIVKDEYLYSIISTYTLTVVSLMKLMFVLKGL